jgi:hypothetical protein
MSERGENASIYDLLQHEEEAPRPARRQRTGAGWWVSTTLTVAALTAVTVFVLRLSTLGVSWPGVFAGYFALFLLRRVTARVAPPPPPRAHRHASTDDGLYVWGGRDALRGAVKRWEVKLVWSQGEQDRFARGVLPALGELVDERLRQRHRLTRATDPDRARALLGKHLWSFLATPARRPPSPRELAAIVDELEKT